MDTLRLYHPAKPYIVTQAWGIRNSIYKENGIDMERHNGEDFRIGADNLVHCPLPAEVIETGYDNQKGNFARLVSLETFVVGGVTCKVGFVVMHGEKVLVQEGDELDIGDAIMVPDNTGFSTGPHTHISFYRLGGMYWNERLDLDTSTNNTFDPHPYWTGFAAQDYDTLIVLYQQLAAALKNGVAQLMKSRSAPPAPTFP